MFSKCQAHELTGDRLKNRKVVKIDIAHDPVKDYKEAEDPKKFRSKKTERGPLSDPDWMVKVGAAARTMGKGFKNRVRLGNVTKQLIWRNHARPENG